MFAARSKWGLCPSAGRHDHSRVTRQSRASAWGRQMKHVRIASRILVAATAVAAFACTDSPNPVSPRPSDGLTPTMSRGAAQDRLAALFANASPAVMALGGTVFADNDEAAGKLVFGIENEHARAGVERALQALGVAKGEYAIEVTAPIEELATLQSKFRPTQAGIQIHFGNYVCSLGFNGTDGSERSMYTASHCTNTQGGVEGTTYAQPLRSVDPTVIATEVEDPAYFKGGVCPRGKICRYSDASRALYNPDVASNRGEIAKTDGVNNNSLNVAGTLTVTSQDNTTTNFAINTQIDKLGRTTGWSRGPVTRTCVNTNVSGSRVHQLCQTFVEAAVAGGDSGSPVFKSTSGSDNVQLVGILWGGGSNYFVFSPLAQVQQELGSLTATK
jgi:hypothetical protein